MLNEKASTTQEQLQENFEDVDNHTILPKIPKKSSSHQKSNKKAVLEANSSFGSNSTTSTSLHGSIYSSTRTLPITETTSVDSYEEKSNLQDLQRIMREVQDLKTLTSTYRGLQAKRV